MRAAVGNVEEYMRKIGQSLATKAPTPIASQYCPKVDISEELGEADASYFHSLIGVLRWIVKLGQVDSCVEISMLSSHISLP